MNSWAFKPAHLLAVDRSETLVIKTTGNTASVIAAPALVMKHTATSETRTSSLVITVAGDWDAYLSLDIEYTYSMCMFYCEKVSSIQCVHLLSNALFGGLCLWLTITSYFQDNIICG